MQFIWIIQKWRIDYWLPNLRKNHCFTNNFTFVLKQYNSSSPWSAMCSFSYRRALMMLLLLTCRFLIVWQKWHIICLESVQAHEPLVTMITSLQILNGTIRLDFLGPISVSPLSTREGTEKKHAVLKERITIILE